MPGPPKVKANGAARYAFDAGDYKSYVQGTVNHQSSTTYSLESTSYYAGDTPSFTTFDLSVSSDEQRVAVTHPCDDLVPSILE